MQNMLEKLIGKSKALERAIAGEDLNAQDGMELMESDDHYMIGAVADATRKKLVGDKVTFTVSSYLNYTNVCAASCQICAFYRKENDNDAYTLTPEQIESRVSAAKMMGATEMHIVGGFHPKLSLDYYESMMKIIKKNHPELKIKAFTAAEIFFFAKLTKNSVKEVLSRLKDSGLDSLPGGGAELFHPEIREKIARGKCSGDEWLDTMEQAHNLGIKSNATMLYGHIERPEHIVDHLLKIRSLQKKTGGFLKVVALSRLMLSGFLNNISVYWVADGKKLAQVALSHGGNDLVGTAFSEEVYRAAGKSTNSSLLDLVNLVKEIKRKPAQRDTFFNIIRTF